MKEAMTTTDTTAAVTPFTRVYHLGLAKEDRGEVFVKVELRPDGELSLSGVEGPKRNGDAKGACGQIQMHLTPQSFERFAPGWDAQSVGRLLDIWRAWHLNHMRAGCEHQRANWKPSEEIEVVTYGLTTDAYQERERLKRRLLHDAQETGTATADTDEAALLALPWERHDAPDADSPASGRYEVKKRETKTAGWVRPQEHPRGLLCKPCEVCGYKYGTAWLSEDVPADVLRELRNFPQTDTTPAWV